MLVIGLTGGIGMGKSAAAERFADHDIPVFNADACVHRLYEGDAVGPIEAAFPGVTRKGRVDRKLLSERIAGSPERLRQLEQVVHPLVIEAELDFLRAQEDKGAALAVLEIPSVRDRRRCPCRRNRGAERPPRRATSPRAGPSRHDRR